MKPRFKTIWNVSAADARSAVPRTFGNIKAVDDQPSPHPKDLAVLAVLQDLDGSLTEVIVRSGQTYRCFNIAWGYDVGDEFSHVTTNASPFVEGEAIDFFFTNEVTMLRDPAGTTLFDDSSPS